MVWIVMLAACSTEGGPGEDGEGSYTLTGEVTSAGSSADVFDAKAFGVNAGGKAAIVVSPNADATCDDAADMRLSTDPSWNPSVVNAAGACSLYVEVASYAGEEITLSDAADATVSFNCAMDEGQWAWEERTEGDGYFYDGPWWVGSPEAFELTLSGGDEADLTFALSFDGAMGGSFIDDAANPDPDPGTGSVAGDTVVTWCPDLGPALAR